MRITAEIIEKYMPKNGSRKHPLELTLKLPGGDRIMVQVKKRLTYELEHARTGDTVSGEIRFETSKSKAGITYNNVYLASIENLNEE